MTRKFNIVPLKNRRRQLRQDSTLAEIILWNNIRNKKLGFRFVRQYSVSGYVMDFYCPSQKLGIELEGEIHLKNENKIYDNHREKFSKEFGINLLKFTNKEVMSNLSGILDKVSLSLLKRGIKG